MTRPSRSRMLVLIMPAVFLLCIALEVGGFWLMSQYDGWPSALGFLLFYAGFIVGLVVARPLGYALTNWRDEWRMIAEAKAERQDSTADVHEQLLAELDAKFARYADIPPTWPPGGETDDHIHIGQFYFARGLDGQGWRSEDGLLWARHPASDYADDDPTAVVPCATQRERDA